MRLLIFLIFISFSFNACAQKPIFVRVYDLSGKKISQGFVQEITDSSLKLEGRKGPINISDDRIGSIQTKRSNGSNIIIASVIGGFAGGIIGAVTPSPGNSFLNFSKSEAVILGTLTGAAVGVVIGAITTLFKHSKRYVIKGNKTKWKVFQTMINENNRSLQN